MSITRPFVLSIAGFDPTGGAGVLADIKTFEQLQVYGLSVLTCNTLQTCQQFHKMDWISLKKILKSINLLFKEYPIKAVKIGVLPNLNYLQALVATIHTLAPHCFIVWDPVIKSSTNHTFLKFSEKQFGQLKKQNITLITPNLDELSLLNPNAITLEAKIQNLGAIAPILLKGGHATLNRGTDTLFLEKNSINFTSDGKNITEKHGSGCILSAAITAQLALNKPLIEACKIAKNYIEKILSSNPSLLAYHAS